MMNRKPQSRTLIIIIVILLLTNIGLLIFFTADKGRWGKDRRPDKKDFVSEALVKDVGFSKAQMVEFDTLQQLHRRKMRALFDTVQSSRNRYYKMIYSQDTSSILYDSALTVIAGKQKEIDRQIFNHLRQVRSLCTDEQRPKYDSLMNKVGRRMGGKIFPPRNSR